ncbi:MAG: TldD/PmbA family protein, partial [Oligoflexales bacterium]|nr:TldD/PmbA family protein [Oligoflexales bacterium]
KIFVTETHRRKSRNISFLDENAAIPSFERHKPEKSFLSLKPLAIDRVKMEKYARQASLVFKSYPEIKNSYVEFSSDSVTKIFLSSEGVERVWRENNVRLYAYMWFHTNKCNIDTAVVVNTTNFDEIPSLSEFKKRIEKKIDELYKTEGGTQITSYTGPVLLAAVPAGLFIHEVVGHRLEGSRLLSDDEGRTFRDKTGEKIMHEDLTIYDDPTIRKWKGRSLTGSFSFDDEGTRPKRALLVENGILRNFLTTRSPIRKKGFVNNGHARNQNHERSVSRMGNLVIESNGKYSFEGLKELLIKEIVKKKIPYGIILYDVEGGETGTEAYNFQAFLGNITRAVKVFPDGREEHIRGVDFVGTPLSSLSNIIAVGRDLELDNGFCGAESGSVPVSTVSPALLLSGLELQAKEPNKVTQYILPLPWYEKKM